MTKKELIKKLKTIRRKDYWQTERPHVEADGLLLKYIGDKEVTKAFEGIKKY